MNCRETALNVFLGAVLLGVPLLFFVLLCFAGRFAVHALAVGVSYLYPPAAALGDKLTNLVFPSLLLLVSVKEFVRKRWRSAFLSLATGTAISLVFAQEFRANAGLDIPFAILFVFLFAGISSGNLDRDLPPATFLIASAVLCLAALAPLGLLGSGWLACSADDVFKFVSLGWLVWHLRKERSRDNEGPDSGAGVVQAS